ncbi:MAG: M1 family peptidase, partial [Gammaproteobacteria bacterium]|nr:M1 family metallopeptidase [Gemmatimonadota bacterium]NIU75031.1 M1 family peptidase [Gammaproteobacteria bacterium]NIX22608.1 M1 family peptidase [Actinomycetota bacterium]
LRPDGCVPVSVWSFPPDSGAAARSFARAPEIVELYSRLVAPFPYPELAHVQSATRFGGMENAGAIFYAARAVAGGRDLDGLIAHETA